MKFGVFLPNAMQMVAITQPWEHALGGADLVRVARLAEELGYFCVPVPEHFVTPPSHLELSGNHWFDATTAQAFLAGATTRLRPLSMVTLLPLHHPIMAAKAIATLDWFSGGRALVAIGIGWDEEEFDVLGVPFATRGRRADEYLAAMFELWDCDEPSFDGEFVSFRAVRFGPKPIQRPHPPIWIGGDADGALRRAARFGDGWSPWLTTPEQFPARMDFLRSQPGFDDRPFDVCYNPDGLVIGERHVVSGDPGARFGRTAQEEIERCCGLADLGVTVTSFLPPPVRDLEEYLDYLRWAAEEVVPHVA